MFFSINRQRDVCFPTNNIILNFYHYDISEQIPFYFVIHTITRSKLHFFG